MHSSDIITQYLFSTFWCSDPLALKYMSTATTYDHLLKAVTFLHWNILIWVPTITCNILMFHFLGGLSLHLNHLIASGVTDYDWLFGTLPFGLFWSNFDTMDLETYPRTYSGHFWHMSLFDNSRAVWVLFRKWVVSENQSFLGWRSNCI